MATAALIPISEYMDTVYEPDCDYLDGVLEERNVGTRRRGAVPARDELAELAAMGQ